MEEKHENQTACSMPINVDRLISANQPWIWWWTAHVGSEYAPSSNHETGGKLEVCPVLLLWHSCGRFGHFEYEFERPQFHTIWQIRIELFSPIFAAPSNFQIAVFVTVQRHKDGQLVRSWHPQSLNATRMYLEFLSYTIHHTAANTCIPLPQERTQMQ